MMRLLKSGWLAALLGAVVYGAVTAVLFNPAQVIPPHAAHAAAEDAPTPSWEFFNPEVDQLIKELAKEKETLATRQKQLDELARRLEAERAELNVVTQAVHLMQREFDRNLTRVKDEEQANLKRLAKTYSTMSPDAAASVFKQMEDEQVVKILAFMKEAEMALLLESLSKAGEAEAKRVVTLTEKLRTVLFRATPPKS